MPCHDNVFTITVHDHQHNEKEHVQVRTTAANLTQLKNWIHDRLEEEGITQCRCCDIHVDGDNYVESQELCKDCADGDVEPTTYHISPRR